MAEHSSQAVLLSSQHLADRILHDTVGRRDDALRCQIIQEFTEDIDQNVHLARRVA